MASTTPTPTAAAWRRRPHFQPPTAVSGPDPARPARLRFPEHHLHSPACQSINATRTRRDVGTRYCNGSGARAVRGILTQLPSRPTRVALASHTPSTRHGCTPSRSTTKLPGTGRCPPSTPRVKPGGGVEAAPQLGSARCWLCSLTPELGCDLCLLLAKGPVPGKISRILKVSFGQPMILPSDSAAKALDGPARQRPGRDGAQGASDSSLADAPSTAPAAGPH